MSKPKKSDHWLDLAQEIGVEVDSELVKPEETDEWQDSPAEPASEEVAEQSAPAGRDEPSDAEPSTGVESEAVSETPTEPSETPTELSDEGRTVSSDETSSPVAVDSEEEVSPTAAPKPPASDNWFDLASSLGIDVPPPAPSQDAELEEAKATGAESKSQQEAEPTQESTAAAPDKVESPPAPQGFFKTVSNAISKAMSRADEPVKVPGDSSSVESPAEASTASPAASAQDADADKPDDSTESDGPVSLFENPDLRLDTPGVLDAVFDGDEAVIAKALGGPRPSRRGKPVPIKAESDVEEAVESTSEFAREVADFAAEGHAEEPEDEESTGADEDDEPSRTEKSEETSDLEPDEDQKRGRRRKRRRRRKPARRERDEAADTNDDEEAKDGSADASEAAPDQAPPREDRGPSKRRQEADQNAGDDDRADQQQPVEKAKHKKIPTWEEAIGVLVATNLETRSKNPGGGSRGRGRRGHR
jgi:hypothetical protein